MEMANRKLTDLTKVAQKGLRGFFEAEDGGTSQKAALSMGLLAGGVLMMEHLATQSAYGDNAKHCDYSQSLHCTTPPYNDTCRVENGPENGGPDGCQGQTHNGTFVCNDICLCNF